MEFKVSPWVSHLFADAAAAFIRSKADTVWLNEASDEWNELYTAFRDADTATVKVSYEAGRLLFWVWGARGAWRDEVTRRTVAAELRPQWRAQMQRYVLNK